VHEGSFSKLSLAESQSEKGESSSDYECDPVLALLNAIYEEDFGRKLAIGSSAGCLS
jgi:hypothetical protein